MITTTQMQLVDINKLIPYVNNARTHSPEQITKLRSSLREFGFINPVLIDRKYNVLAGHGRIAAAKEEGITEVPCVFVEHLSEAQKKAYILADNRMAMDAGWDTDLLLVEMESLKDMGFDIGMTGFDEKEIADLFETDTEGEEDNFDVDAELEKPCFSKTGDVWHISRHTVICGDSTDPETYKRLLGDTAEIEVKVEINDAACLLFINQCGHTADRCFTIFRSLIRQRGNIAEEKPWQSRNGFLTVGCLLPDIQFPVELNVIGDLFLP